MQGCKTQSHMTRTSKRAHNHTKIKQINTKDLHKNLKKKNVITKFTTNNHTQR